MKVVYLIIYSGGKSALVRASSPDQAGSYSELFFADVPLTITVATQERTEYAKRMGETIYDACLTGGKV